MTPASFYALLGSPFGRSKGYGPRFHAGQDYPWRVGTAIPAFAKGRVVAKGKTIEAGYYVVLLIGGRYFLFYHMREASPLSVGDDVKYGDIIGYVGATGKTTGGHLHLAASTSPIPGQGTRVDPVPLVAKYLQASLASGSKTIEIVGNPVKIIYKTTTQPGSKPLWALADDEAIDPANAGFVETRDTNVVSNQWAPRYGAFVGKSSTEFAALRTKYRAPRTNAPSGGGSMTDVQVAALGTALAKAIKVPTADEVAKAVVRELKLPGN